jgi:hypothetical protein
MKAKATEKEVRTASLGGLVDWEAVNKIKIQCKAINLAFLYIQIYSMRHLNRKVLLFLHGPAARVS